MDKLRNICKLIFDKDIHWKTSIELSENTGLSVQEINNVIEKYDDFVKNSKNKINTKNNYFKYESFFKRFKDLLNGKIK